MMKQAEPGIDALQEIVARALDLAKQNGASAAEGSASFSSGLSVTVRLREVETLEYHRDQGLGLTVYFGQRKGSASTSDISIAAVEETVRRACGLARYGEEDDCAGLADPARLARNIPDLDLHHPWSLEPHQAIELATECEAAALDHDERIRNSEGATVGTLSGCRVYGNTNDFLAGFRDSSHSLSCAVLAEGDGGMERDFEYTVSRNADDLLGPVVVGREAAAKAVKRLGATKLDTRKAPVLFPARLARGFFGHLLGAISGGSLYRKSTFLLDSLDTQVLADFVTIDERPHLPAGLASSPFDDEGVATVDRRLVDAGVIKGYILGSYYARKLGMESTGNAGGIHNLIVSDTGHGFTDLLAEMDRGLLVTELIGHGVNPVTGDYSRGAVGFWVENGEIRFPVAEITMAGNLQDMYRHIVAIGNDVDLRGGIRTGSVLVEEMTIAGS
ncbi:MAG: metalloprotease PmbA [Gammaproteobacteria bacterium]|nr:MAG: metalloprotease PmbA [Gammaproteobacteria bacterium]